MTGTFFATDHLVRYGIERFPDVEGHAAAYATGFHDALMFVMHAPVAAVDFLNALNREVPVGMTLSRDAAYEFYAAFVAAREAQ